MTYRIPPPSLRLIVADLLERRVYTWAQVQTLPVMTLRLTWAERKDCTHLLCVHGLWWTETCVQCFAQVNDCHALEQPEPYEVAS